MYIMKKPEDVILDIIADFACKALLSFRANMMKVIFMYVA